MQANPLLILLKTDFDALDLGWALDSICLTSTQVIMAPRPYFTLQILDHLLLNPSSFRQLKRASFQEENGPEKEPLVHYFHPTHKNKFACCLSYSGFQNPVGEIISQLISIPL